MKCLRVLGWCVGALALALLGLCDTVYGTFSHHPPGLLALAAALLAVAVTLAVPWLGPVALPSAALAAAVVVPAAGAVNAFAGCEMPFGFAVTPALLVLLGAVAWRGHRALALVAGPLLVAAVVTQPLLVERSEVFVLVCLSLTVVGVVAAAAGVTARLVAVSRQRQERAVRLAQRAEFARDLHDYVAHHVTGIVLLAQGAHAIQSKQPQLVGPALQRIEEAGTEAVATMRRMVGLLREADTAAELGPPAGVADIEDLVGRFTTVGGPSARLALDGAFDDLPVEVQSTLHRVVMESLTNIRKHAVGADRVDVALARRPGVAGVRVSDDGRPAHRSLSGFGLRGLTDRVTALGGTITAGPGPGGGWLVEAELPSGGKS